MKKFIIFLAIAIMLALAGCLGSKGNDKELGSASLKIPAYEITAPATGKLLGLIVEQGEHIGKEQPLFAISDEKTDAAVKKSATELAQAKAKLKKLELSSNEPAPAGELEAAQANFDAAQKQAAKMNNLYAMGAISRKQAQAAQNQLVEATIQLQGATQQMLNSQPATPEAIFAQKQSVEKLQERHQKLLLLQQANEVISPCTGIITEKLAKINEQVSKGQLILKLQSTESCIINLDVSEAKAGQLHTGQQVSLHTDQLPASFPGIISSIDDTEITIISDKMPRDLKAGTSVKVLLP